jgi:hypothetical protein
MELFKLPLPKEENYRHYLRYKKFIESRPLRESKKPVTGFSWELVE